MTSEAFTDILYARSATLIVSGTCTSYTCASCGAVKFDGAPSLRSPRRPTRGARQPGRLPPAGARWPGFSALRFFASSAQLDDSFSDLTAFLSPGFAAVAVTAPGTPTFLWIVPLIS